MRCFSTFFTPGLNDGRGVLVDQYQQIVGGAPLIGAAEISDPSHTIHPTESVISSEARRAAGERQGHVFWLFGRPAAGKSTIAREVEARLFRDGQRCVVLDGDSLRAGLNSDLGFSQEDRRENIRRTAHVARMFAETGHIVLVALVTPMKSERALASEIIGNPSRKFLSILRPIFVNRVIRRAFMPPPAPGRSRISPVSMRYLKSRTIHH